MIPRCFIPPPPLPGQSSRVQAPPRRKSKLHELGGSLGIARSLADLRHPSIRKHAGFSYLALLIFIGILGLSATATLTLGSIAQRRMAEEELLWVGNAYRRAILSYYEAMPEGMRRYPPSLDELLLDARQLKPRRHLRQRYLDPINASTDWLLIRHSDGGIMAIASRSSATPIKLDLFAPENADFKGRQHYHDWVFVARPARNTGPGTTPAPAG